MANRAVTLTEIITAPRALGDMRPTNQMSFDKALGFHDYLRWYSEWARKVGVYKIIELR